MMKSQPLLSIIIPVFNGEKYLEETIQSVIDCSVGHSIEIIVIDDGSTDQTALIIRKFRNCLKVICQANLGESAAVNSGIQNAKGEYLLVVSADDPIFTEELFKDVAHFFDNNPNVVAWYPDWRIIDSNGNIIEERLTEEYSEAKLLGEFNCLPGPGTIFRKTAAQKISGRNTHLKFTGDYDFWLRLSRLGDLKRRPKILAQWRMHDQSTSVSKRGLEMANERIKVIEDFLARNQVEQSTQRSALAHAYYFAARLSLFDPKIPGKKYIYIALKTQRKWIKNASATILLLIFLVPLSSMVLRFSAKLRKRL